MISVIVPVYNCELYLEQCLGSIVGQRCQGFEVLLINDGSIHRSGSICDEFVARGARFRFTHKVRATFSELS